MATTKLRIANVTEKNKYKGSYKRIFDILNEDRVFTESYETEKSIGLKKSIYYLEVGEHIDPDKMERILKLKNVKIGWF